MACCCELQNTLDVEVTQDALLDMEIGGSAGVLLQAKSVDVTENGTSVVAPDDGFDGLKSVEINTNVPEKIIGVPEATDGISFVDLICSDASFEITELTDDNTGWTMSKYFPANIFPNLINATLRMAAITKANALNNLGASGVVRFEGLTTITSGTSQYNDPMPLSATEVYADDLETSNAIFSQKSYPNLQKVSMRKLRILEGRSFYDLRVEGSLKTLIVPELRSYDTWAFLLDYSGYKGFINLIHLEIGSDVSCKLANWNPTNALDASRTDLIEEGSTATNNLQQFLYNFKTYIAERLTDNGKGLTLTLSQAVRDAIQQYPEIVSIITSKGWTISPAPSV